VDDQPSTDASAPTSPAAAESDTATGIVCQQCGSTNQENVQLCAHCGARLLVECPQCGTMNPATLNLCHQCGFDYSQFVTQQVMERVGSKVTEQRQAARGALLSSVLTAALVIFSIIIVVYILRQI
jgi:uncharacterized membrane protein YvbJ